MVKLRNSYNKFYRFFQVIIIHVTCSADYTGVVNPPTSFTPQDLMTYEEAHKSPVPAAYVTFQFGGNDFYKYQEFIVGNGERSNKTANKTADKGSCGDDEYYHNNPLKQNTNYRVFLRAFLTEVLQLVRSCHL